MACLGASSAQGESIRVFADRFGGLPFIPEVPEPSSSRHTARPLGSTAAGQGYWEYLPPGYGGGADYPLMVFIHGLGENGNGGSELDEVLANGPPRLINLDGWANSRPFVVLSPQHSGGGCTTPAEIEAFIDFAQANYAIDPGRIYLTGLSCGAIGSWNYAGQFTDEVVAAMVPIAGNGNGAFNNAGCELGNLPIWAFHGDSDGVVPPGGTTGPIGNLDQCVSPPPFDVRQTIYAGVGHNSWRRTYDLSAGHDIYAWMLSHRRR
jgi:predicted peptidase